MERLVSIGNVREIGSGPAIAADGIELDLSGMSGEEYLLLKERLSGENLRVKSLHYGRTGDISLKSGDLFQGQVDMLRERAREWNVSTISVRPPAIGRESPSTVKDFQDFLEDLEEKFSGDDMRLSFEFVNVMRDPDVVNSGFSVLEGSLLGLSLDLEALMNRGDPAKILEKLEADVHKIRSPLPAEDVEGMLGSLWEDVVYVSL